MLNLNRLLPRRRAEMVAHMTGGKALPKEIADQIMKRTDGVPLFIEELTKAIVESGVLTDAGDRYTVAGPLPPMAIPMSLNASLLSRLDRLAPVREVAQIGAALGRQFSHELISAVAPMPQQQLDDALAQLVSAELIFRRGSPPDAEYTFKHALVQDAAYSTLLRSRRQQIHSRIVATFEDRFPEIVATQPEVLARHCAEAGLVEKAIVYWLKAGQQAVGRSAMTEAVAHLQKGMDSLAKLPETPWRAQQDLDLQIALGRALMATSGYSAPTVAETIVRARALAEQLDRPEYLVPLLFSQRVFHSVRADHKLALSLAEQIEKVGEEQNDEATQLLGHYLHGQSCFFLGEFVAAQTLFEQCHGSKGQAHRAAYAALTVEDPRPASLGFHAWALAFLGYINQACARVDEALSAAQRLDHVYTVAVVSSTVSGVKTIARLPHEVQRHAEQLVALSNQHGFQYWLGWGHIHRGWSLSALGHAQEGHTLLAQGLSMRRATGAVLHTPLALGFLADGYAKVGQLKEGLNCLAEAAQIIEMTEERYYEAELFRLRGDLLNAIGDRAAAEQSYHEALAVAKRQSARTLELRAGTSLARLWRDQGKRIEARDLLAPIYGWFTEGFDAPVLQEAKALLDQLTRYLPC